MRLTPETVQSICRIVHAELGNEAEVYLFGSRLDDAGRGGDIDLYIESPIKSSLMQKASLKLRLETTLGLPFDLVIAQKGMQPTSFERIARQNGVRL